jgi:PPOX class probable F420-dependent enzyme
MTDPWFEKVRSLLEAPAPAVLATYRKDGSALVSPVWFRWRYGGFEVVIAEGDVKLRHLAANPECTLVVFETVPPFRGVEVRGTAELIEGDVTSARREIASRYLGEDAGQRYAAQRSKPGVLVRLEASEPRVWDLVPILPT